MSLDERTLSQLVVALVAAVVVLGIWVAWLQRSEALLRRRLRRVLPQGESGGIDEILDRQLKRVESLTERVDALGNGVVLSSLHSRTDTRVFAKPVQSGRSRYQLSDEEQDAIKKALAPTS